MTSSSHTAPDDSPHTTRRRQRLLDVLKDIGTPTGYIVSDDEGGVSQARWVFVGLAPIPFGQVLNYDITVANDLLDGDSAQLHRAIVEQLFYARQAFEKNLRFILDYGYATFTMVMDAYQLAVVQHVDAPNQDPLDDYRAEHGLTIAPGNKVVRG